MLQYISWPRRLSGTLAHLPHECQQLSLDVVIRYHHLLVVAATATTGALWHSVLSGCLQRGNTHSLKGDNTLPSTKGSMPMSCLPEQDKPTSPSLHQRHCPHGPGSWPGCHASDDGLVDCTQGTPAHPSCCDMRPFLAVLC